MGGNECPASFINVFNSSNANKYSNHDKRIIQPDDKYLIQSITKSITNEDWRIIFSIVFRKTIENMTDENTDDVCILSTRFQE